MTAVEEEQVKKIRSRLIDLMGIVDPKFGSVSSCKKIEKQDFDGILNLIDYLRLGIKYLQLDIEATRREKGHLLKIIESNNESEGVGNE